MEHLFYLNRERFERGNTKYAFKYALKLLKENKDIDTITFLVYQQKNYDAFLGEMNFTSNQFSDHVFVSQGITFQIHTVKTYHPTYFFSEEKNRELLIAVGVPPRELNQFVDKNRVKYWIIVPWTMDENTQFLQINQAVDLETGYPITVNYQVDDRIKGAIEWLKNTSYPNEGYHHPLDENRLKSMANAIKHFNIPFEHDALVNYCINNGLLYDAALQTVEYFERAQRKLFHVTPGYEPNSLLEHMKDNSNT